MPGRFTLVLSIGAAILSAPVAPAAARRCAHPDSLPTSYSDGCCAATPCCVISSESAPQPLTPTPASSDLSVSAAPVCFVSLIDPPASPAQARFAKALPVAHSPPPLALLCSFLI
jgi:hypothetical protein